MKSTPHKPTRQQLLDASTKLIELEKIKERQSKIDEVPLGWLCVEEMAAHNRMDCSTVHKAMKKAGNERKKFTVEGADGRLKQVLYYKIM